MLTNSNPFPLSVRNLDRRLGNARVKDFLKIMSRRDYSVQEYDFVIKALDTTNIWTVAAGGTATTWAVRAEAGGWIRGICGTTAATSGLQLSLPTSYWTGSAVCGMAVLIRPSIITELRMEMGFVNALPSVNTNVLNSLVTPTFNTTASAALGVYDHTGSTTTTGLYTIGTSGAAAAKVATTAYRPVAATPYFMAIECNGTNVNLFTGDSDSPVASATAGITAADALIPAIAIKKSDTTSANIDIDLIVVWSGRLG